MQYEKRVNKDGSFYYSFVWYDTKSKKRLRLTREEIKKRFGKDILLESEAKDCLKLLEAQYQTEKIKIERRLSWEKEFYSFNGLLEQYEKAQKKRAINSWENNVFYLKNYVLPYFLTLKKLNNIEMWSDYFEDFREWLEKSAIQLRSKNLISYSSKNHSIKALNTFLDMLYNKKLIHKQSKCEAFPEHLIKSRTIDDVIYPNEMEQVYLSLKSNKHTQEAILFRYLFFSGMRFSEGLAISLADIYQGLLPENQLLSKKLKTNNITYFGYVVSDSQLNDKKVRVPFKGKREISEKNSRTIPIIDKTLWNDLVSLAEEKFNLWSNSKHTNKKDYYLFDLIDDSTARRRLEEAFRSVKLKFRTWHCLRHSRATWLIGETGDEVLARTWLGHSSPRIFEKYNHMYQALIREAKAKDTVGSEFKLKKV